MRSRLTPIRFLNYAIDVVAGFVERSSPARAEKVKQLHGSAAVESDNLQLPCQTPVSRIIESNYRFGPAETKFDFSSRCIGVTFLSGNSSNVYPIASAAAMQYRLSKDFCLSLLT